MNTPTARSPGEATRGVSQPESSRVQRARVTEPASGERSSPAGTPPVTMQGLAARLGVSAMTVSRALNDRPGVAEATRRRVHDAAAALGYRPNTRASRLRGARSAGLVGLVVTSLGDPLLAGLAAGVEQICADNGARVVLASSNHDQTAESELVADLIARGVDGLVVVPAGDDHTHLSPDRHGDTPLVLATSPPTGVALDCVLADEVGGAHRACRHLIEQGHRRIGFLGSTRSWAGSERFRGYVLAHEAAGAPVDDRYVHRPCADPDDAAAATRDLLMLADRPSALLVTGTPSLLGVLRLTRARPTDPPPAIVGFDIDGRGFVPYPLGVVTHDSVALGRAAAELLFDRRRRYWAPRHVTVESRLVPAVGADVEGRRRDRR